MPAFDDAFGELLRRVDEVQLSATERGAVLEQLVAEAFGAVSGVDAAGRNARSVFDNEEFDLVMTNRAVNNGLFAAGPYFSVECKNWSRPVGSTEVAWFATKLRRSNQHFGVLVAANGVTGSAVGLTAANFEVAAALSEGQHIVILTLQELHWLTSGEELADLLTQKQASLVARREILILNERPNLASLPPWKRRAQTRQERHRRLSKLADNAAVGQGHPGSISEAIGIYKTCLNEFLESEAEEPSAKAGEEISGFDAWAEQNLASFGALEASLGGICEACIVALRGGSGAEWSVEHLELGLDTRAPVNLEAPPDSRLAELLLDHWSDLIERGAEFERQAALLCVLSWAVESLGAVEEERWPGPWL